jgi:predicted amidohydrolase YtcJ
VNQIFINGNIYTMTGRRVEALAIQGGRIAWSGSAEGALALKTVDTRVTDLGGRCVLPGFCDSHMHMLLSGVGFHRLDLRGVRSPEELVERGQAYIRARDIAPGEWVIGYGFDHNLFPKPELPDGRIAEAISQVHPVLLDRVCGHVGTANRLALQKADYTSKTMIPGGELDRDEAGALTGVIRETALDRMKTFIPRLTQAQVEALLREAGERFAACGLTSVHSDDLGPEGTDWDTLSAAMKALEERGELRIRIFQEWEAASVENLQPIIGKGVYTGWGSETLRVCNIKLITDGSLGARTAYLREEYTDDSGNRGIPVYTQEALDELTLLCHRAGLQVAFHAIGDGALEQCVTAVERAMAQDPKPLRHRIVHCQIGSEALYRRMAALGMGADVQPPFTVTDSPHVAPRLGAERARTSYAWKTLLDLGVMVGGGSDSPVEDFAPLWGIYCAVTRSDGEGAPPWMPEQRLSVEQALAIYTQNGAMLACQEADLGTLEAGKLADLVVLDRDICAIDPEEIPNARVLLTMMGGRETFRDAFIT